MTATPSSVPIAAPTEESREVAHVSFAGRGSAERDGRLRVVHCLDSLGVGGTELNAVRTLERLDRSRFDAALMCLRAEGPLRSRLEQAGIPVLEFPISGLLTPSALRQGARLVRFLRRHRVDVLHSHDQYNNFFACMSARVAGVPLVIASRRWSVAHMQRRHLLLNRVGFRFADVVLANSPSVARELASVDGLDERQLVTISNWVDDAAFAPFDGVSRRAAIGELGVPAGATVLGVVARLDAVKGHATLLQAMAELARERPRLHLVLVGDGPCRQALESDAERLGIRARVHFAGTRPQLPNLHGLFDVSVLPSLSEGFPNSVVEAMAAGRPVVATAVGGTVDAIENGQSGVLVPAGDSTALAEAIAKLLDDPARASALGDAARRRARNLFHASSVLPQLERLYERAATRRARHATVASTAHA